MFHLPTPYPPSQSATHQPPQPKLLLQSSITQLLPVHQQQSSCSDIDRKLYNLGLQIVNVSEKQLPAHINLQRYYCIDKSKFKDIMRYLIHGLNQLKHEILSIKQQIINTTQDIMFQSVRYQLEEPSTLIKSQSNIINKSNQKYTTNYQNTQENKNNPNPNKLTLDSTFSINATRQFSLFSAIDSPPKRSYPQKLNQNNQNPLQLELKKLHQQTDKKTKQLQLLREQLQTIKKLSQKKQAYFNQKLKYKQLQWQRKINQIIHDWQYIKKKLHTQDNQYIPTSQHQKKRTKTQNSDPSSSCHNINKNWENNNNYIRNTVSNGFNFITPGNLTRNHHHVSSYNQFKTHTLNSHKNKKNNKDTININNNTKDIISNINQHQTQDQLRIQKQQSRKQSTELSFQRVFQKIKYLEYSFKKNIQQQDFGQ